MVNFYFLALSFMSMIRSISFNTLCFIGTLLYRQVFLPIHDIDAARGVRYGTSL